MSTNADVVIVGAGLAGLTAEGAQLITLRLAASLGDDVVRLSAPVSRITVVRRQCLMAFVK